MTNYLFDKKYDDSADEWDTASMANRRVVPFNRASGNFQGQRRIRISPLTKLLLAFNVMMIFTIVAAVLWTPPAKRTVQKPKLGTVVVP